MGRRIPHVQVLLFPHALTLTCEIYCSHVQHVLSTSPLWFLDPSLSFRGTPKIVFSLANHWAIDLGLFGKSQVYFLGLGLRAIESSFQNLWSRFSELSWMGFGVGPLLDLVLGRESWPFQELTYGSPCGRSHFRGKILHFMDAWALLVCLCLRMVMSMFWRTCARLACCMHACSIPFRVGECQQATSLRDPSCHWESY